MGSVAIGGIIGGAVGSACFVVIDDTPEEAFVCGGFTGCSSGMIAGMTAQSLYDGNPPIRH